MNLLLVMCPYTGRKQYLDRELIKELYVDHEIQENKPIKYFLKVSILDSHPRTLKEYSSLEIAQEAMHTVAYELTGEDGTVVKAPEENELC